MCLSAVIVLPYGRGALNCILILVPSLYLNEVCRQWQGVFSTHIRCESFNYAIRHITTVSLATYWTSLCQLAQLQRSRTHLKVITSQSCRFRLYTFQHSNQFWTLAAEGSHCLPLGTHWMHSQNPVLLGRWNWWKPAVGNLQKSQSPGLEVETVPPSFRASFFLEHTQTFRLMQNRPPMFN